MAGLLALSFATLFSITSASCIHARDLEPRALEPRAEVATFGYTALQGPLNWFGLNQNANVLCARGRNQSPINLNPSTSGIRTLGAGSRPSANYPNVQEADFENLGSTVEVVLGNGTLRYQNADYTLLQFHFHTPSEHRLLEEFYPMEVHFVHRRTTPLPDGTQPILVIGIVFQISEGSASSALFTNVLGQVSRIASPGSETKVRGLNFNEVKGHIEGRDLFQYGGSLTTPPCTEGVTWLVSKDPLPIAPATFNRAKGVIKFNSRYTQNNPGQQNLLEYEAGLLRP